jgi:hypothetical protein
MKMKGKAYVLAIGIYQSANRSNLVCTRDIDIDMSAAYLGASWTTQLRVKH